MTKFSDQTYTYLCAFCAVTFCESLLLDVGGAAECGDRGTVCRVSCPSQDESCSRLSPVFIVVCCRLFNTVIMVTFGGLFCRRKFMAV